MYLIDKLAEQKITEAIENGELDNLPGQGRPLELDDDSMVPEDLRAACRLLKNAGYLPPQLSLRREVANVESLLRQTRSQDERRTLNKRMNYLLLQPGISSPERPIAVEKMYLQKMHHRSTPNKTRGDD